MEEIFEEVNEDLKQKQLREFWEENRNWIIGGVVGSIIATASMSGYRSWEMSRNTRETTALSEIVSELKDGKTEDLENFIPTTSKNHALIARMVLAATYVENGEIEKAVNTYAEIASTKGIDKNYRNYAKFLNVKYRADDLSSAELATEISDLLDTNWKHVSLELLALSQAKEGMHKEAVETLNKLTSDAATPNALRGRAVKLTELYSSKTVK